MRKNFDSFQVLGCKTHDQRSKSKKRPNVSKETTEPAAELYGIETIWNAPEESHTTSNKKIISAIKRTGVKEINKFYTSIHQNEKLVLDHLKAHHDSINTSPYSLGALSVGTYFSYQASVQHAPAVTSVLGGSFILLSQPVSMISYRFIQDKAFERAENEAIRILSSDPPNPNSWSFQSWHYQPIQKLVSDTWENGLKNLEIPVKSPVYLQAMQDSQGWLNKKFTCLKQSPQEKTDEAKTWVHIDQLIRTDAEGIPTLWLVLRAEGQRPLFPKKADGKRETEFNANPALIGLQAIPVLGR